MLGPLPALRPPRCGAGSRPTPRVTLGRGGGGAQKLRKAKAGEGEAALLCPGSGHCVTPGKVVNVMCELKDS